MDTNGVRLRRLNMVSRITILGMGMNIGTT
jgi:hypothetical protein